MFDRLFGRKSKGDPIAERKEPLFGEPVAPAAPPARPGDLAIEVAGFMEKFLRHGYQDERGVHLESLISATAALAGYAGQQAALAMIRAGDSDAKRFPELAELPGRNGETYLVCELANQLVAQGGGPDRLTVLALVGSAGLQAGGSQIPDMVEILKRNGAAMGGPDYPSLSVPLQHRPRDNPIVALRRWWPVLVKMFSVDETRSLHPIYRMLAMGHLTGRWIGEGKGILSPDIAMQLAMESAVAASKVTGVSDVLQVPPS